MNAGTFNNNSQEIQSPHGSYLAHMDNKDVIAMLGSNPTYYVLKDSHTKALHHQTQQTTSQCNISNSHTLMTNSHKKQETTKSNLNTNHY